MKNCFFWVLFWDEIEDGDRIDRMYCYLLFFLFIDRQVAAGQLIFEQTNYIIQIYAYLYDNDNVNEYEYEYGNLDLTQI